MNATATMPETMLAAVWHGDGRRIQVERIPVPRPAADEALVRIAACGVCHTDLHVLKREVAFPAPAVLGHEISGTIVGLGPTTMGETMFAAGDRVVGAFIMPCTRCRQCERGRDDLCTTFFAENRLRGNLLDGTSRLRRMNGDRLSMYSMAGLAEYAVVPTSALAALPDGLPLEDAAVLGCAAFTAYGAASNASLVAGDSVVVVAAGGIGSSIIQVAAQLGAHPIIAVDVDDEKLANASALGAHVVVNSIRDDVRAAVEAVAPGGVDVAFEALGRPATFELAVSLLADGGRMVAVGIAAGGAAAAVPITPLVRRGSSIRGSFGARTRTDLPRVVELAARGGFDIERAVTRRFSLEDADRAYALLDEGGITGRAIVVPRHGAG